MELVKQGFSLYRGDDEAFLVKVKGDIDLNDVERIDLHARFEKKVGLKLSTTDGTIKIIDGAILLDFASHTHENAEWKKAPYDLQLTFKSGRVRTIMTGHIELTHDYTRGVK